MKTDFDVVVIGSGIAGSLLAWKLALQGKKVVILEAGDYGPQDKSGDPLLSRIKKVSQFAMSPAQVPSSPYSGTRGDVKAPRPNMIGIEKNYFDQSGSPRVYKSNYERIVGGSTWHWLGNVPRLVPNDFRMSTEYKLRSNLNGQDLTLDWPISYRELEPYYCEAEQAIGVSGDHDVWNGVLGAHRSVPFPMQEVWQSYGDSVIKRRLNGKRIRGVALDVLPTPQARNSEPFDNRPPCAGNSICVPICPIQAKYDATVHVNKATKKQAGDPEKKVNAELRERCVVTKLEVGSDKRVTKVNYVEWSDDESIPDREQSVTGKIVVLAAHAIESAKLLLLSGLANSSDMVGRNLMDHLQGYVGAILPEPVFPFRGPPTTSGIDNFRDGEFRREEAAFRMSFGNDGWGRQETPYETVGKLVRTDGLFGNELLRAVEDRITRMSRISYSSEQLPDPNNRVELSTAVDATGIQRPKITYNVNAYNRRGFRAARLTAVEIYRMLGSKPEEIDVRYKNDEDYSGAGHIMGTCRMGEDPVTSVVDAQCRTHDHQNLYVIGSAVFTTGGTANPTLTVAALAMRAADSIAEQLGAN